MRRLGFPISRRRLWELEHSRCRLTLDEAFALTQALGAVLANMLIPPPKSCAGGWGLGDRRREREEVDGVRASLPEQTAASARDRAGREARGGGKALRASRR